jgi:hypothetical protein
MVTTLIVVGGIVTFVIIAGLIMSGQMVIERSVTVSRPLQDVFNYVRISRNHDNFSVWNQMDPDMKREYKGTDGEVGFVYKWDSAKDKNVGAGEQETKNIDPNKSLTYELRFTRPMENVAVMKFVFTSIAANETRVLWGFYSESKFPMSLMKPLFQKILGKDLQKGLQNLKVVLEE